MIEGNNVIEVCGNNRSAEAFGCEIYQNDLDQLINATSVDSLNIIFSSIDAPRIDIVEDVDTGEILSKGYSCSEPGYYYDPCTNQCVQDEICTPCPQP